MVASHMVKHMSQSRISCTEDLDITLKHLWMSGNGEQKIVLLFQTLGSYEVLSCIPSRGMFNLIICKALRQSLISVLYRYSSLNFLASNFNFHTEQHLFSATVLRLTLNT